MRQLTLWGPKRPPRIHRPRPPKGCECPGCGSKKWLPAVWLGGYVLGICRECADDQDVRAGYLMDNRPADPYPCPFPKGSDERIAWMAERVAGGFSCFQDGDWNHLPAPFKKPKGAPDHRAEPGETGVEKCGDKFRVRPFWRGRKWKLGIYLYEAEARDRAREFRLVHGPDASDKPVLWLPTGDEDGAIPIEPKDLKQWAVDFPTSDARAVAADYRRELKRMRHRPPTAEVYQELLRRLAAAAGPVLFDVLNMADESADYPMGV